MSARVGASGSGWVPLSSNQDGLNKISIRKDLDESQPVSISFTCSREQPPFSKNQSTIDRKSTRLNSSHIQKSRMPSSA